MATPDCCRPPGKCHQSKRYILYPLYFIYASEVTTLWRYRSFIIIIIIIIIINPLGTKFPRVKY